MNGRAITVVLLLVASQVGWAEVAYRPVLEEQQLLQILRSGWAQAPPAALRHLDLNHDLLEREWPEAPPDEELSQWVQVARSRSLRGLFRADRQESGAELDLLAALEFGRRLRARRSLTSQAAGNEVLTAGFEAYITWLGSVVQSEQELSQTGKALERLNLSKVPVTLGLSGQLSLEMARVARLCQNPDSRDYPESLLIRLRSSQRQQVLERFERLAQDYHRLIRRELQHPRGRTVNGFLAKLEADQPVSRVVMPTPQQLAGALALKYFPRLDEAVELQLAADSGWRAALFLTEARRQMMIQGTDWAPTLLEAPLDPFGGRMKWRYQKPLLRLTDGQGTEYQMRIPPLPEEVLDEQES